MLKTLAAFNTPLEAHLVRGILEAEGIESLLTNEQIMGVHPGLNFALGGVQLKVREEDYERAQAILNGQEEEIDERDETFWEDSWDKP
jgi:hypothetical protein